MVLPQCDVNGPGLGLAIDTTNYVLPDKPMLSFSKIIAMEQHAHVMIMTSHMENSCFKSWRYPPEFLSSRVKILPLVLEFF